MAHETTIDRIDQMAKLLRNLKSNYKRLSKLSEADVFSMTQRQAQKRNTDADWIGMDNIKTHHELHALAVELGIAERRDSYSEIRLTDGWHEYRYTPREPNS